MELVFTILVLLLAVALSSVVARLTPFHVPLPLMQIAFGALLAFPAFNIHITFNPEVFLLLFIPPLLFVDGWRIPKRDFFRQHFAILMMALGLVFFTVLTVGLFIHFITGIPYAAAFALAAVLSPTDAVAVSGIVGRDRLPKSLMNLLEGEALMNDASGLVALKFAVAAMLTGYFSLSEASISFLFIALGGVALGAAISFLASKVILWLGRYTGEDPATQTIFLILLPFVAYVIAERAGASGILAAVAAGIMQSYTQIMSSSLLMRLRSESVWEMLEVVFNGMVFILLGLQLPHIMGHLPEYTQTDKSSEVWLMMFFIITIGTALLAIRFGWVTLLARFLKQRAQKRGEIPPISNHRDIAIITFAGVRGAVTLAGVLSIPLLLNDGSPFPARGTLIFIAAGVIVFSLLCAVIALPILLRGLPDGVGSHSLGQVKLLLRLRAEAAITAVEQMRDQRSENSSAEEKSIADEVGVRVIARYREQLLAGGDAEETRQRSHAMQRLEIEMRLTGLRAERALLYRQRKSLEIDETLLQEQLRELDLTEAALLQQADRIAKS